jgi:hypothetical protein
MEEKIVEYAPIIIVVLGFILQNNIFVKPEQLERKHREILKEVDAKFDETEKEFGSKYVELNAYKEFQSHMYSELEKISSGVEDLKNFLMGKGR